MCTLKYSSVFPFIALFLSLQACVKGKGPVISQTFEPGSFDRIEMSTAGEVTVLSDSIAFVKISSNENIIQSLQLKLNNGRLLIATKPGKVLRKYDVLDIEIHSPAPLQEISTSASGNISCNGCLHSQATVKTSASGNIDVTGTFSDITAEASGSGSVTLQGSASKATYKTSASGNILGFGCISQHTDARCSASGNIETSVLQKLTGSISGSGNIRYKGDPSEIDVKDNASGQLEKVN